MCRMWAHLFPNNGSQINGGYGQYTCGPTGKAKCERGDPTNVTLIDSPRDTARLLVLSPTAIVGMGNGTAQLSSDGGRTWQRSPGEHEQDVSAHMREVLQTPLCCDLLANQQVNTVSCVMCRCIIRTFPLLTVRTSWMWIPTSTQQAAAPRPTRPTACCFRPSQLQ